MIQTTEEILLEVKVLNLRRSELASAFKKWLRKFPHRLNDTYPAIPIDGIFEELWDGILAEQQRLFLTQIRNLDSRIQKLLAEQ
jgi:hypothetical protein